MYDEFNCKNNLQKVKISLNCLLEIQLYNIWKIIYFSLSLKILTIILLILF